jgi:hypothetical protein
LDLIKKRETPLERSLSFRQFLGFVNSQLSLDSASLKSFIIELICSGVQVPTDTLYHVESGDEPNEANGTSATFASSIRKSVIS